MRRAYGTGGLYERNGKWTFQRSFTGTARVRGRVVRVRKSVTADTPEEALRLGALLEMNPNQKRRRNPDWAWVEKHRGDHLTSRDRKARSLDYIKQVIDESRAEDWTDTYTADAILAQLTPSRIRRGIFGPCAYCGTWLATTIDHVIPTARGGPDTADNLVSACRSCNYSKADKLPSEWSPRTNMTNRLADSRSTRA